MTLTQCLATLKQAAAAQQAVLERQAAAAKDTAAEAAAQAPGIASPDLAQVSPGAPARVSSAQRLLARTQSQNSVGIKSPAQHAQQAQRAQAQPQSLRTVALLPSQAPAHAKDASSSAMAPALSSLLGSAGIGNPAAGTVTATAAPDEACAAPQASARQAPPTASHASVATTRTCNSTQPAPASPGGSCGKTAPAPAGHALWGGASGSGLDAPPQAGPDSAAPILSAPGPASAASALPALHPAAPGPASAASALPALHPAAPALSVFDDTLAGSRSLVQQAQQQPPQWPTGNATPLLSPKSETLHRFALLHGDITAQASSEPPSTTLGLSSSQLGTLPAAAALGLPAKVAVGTAGPDRTSGQADIIPLSAALVHSNGLISKPSRPVAPDAASVESASGTGDLHGLAVGRALEAGALDRANAELAKAAVPEKTPAEAASGDVSATAAGETDACAASLAAVTATAADALRSGVAAVATAADAPPTQGTAGHTAANAAGQGTAARPSGSESALSKATAGLPLHKREAVSATLQPDHGMSGNA